MEELAGVLLEKPGLSIELHGHTDDTGSVTFNQEFSERRAVAENTDEAGRQLNRRVEVKIIQQH